MLWVTNATVSARDPHNAASSASSLRAGDLVERAERLVHEEEIGLGDERARDRHAHLHAARELARIARRERREPDELERRRDRAVRGGPVDPREVEGQPDVRGDPRPRHQRCLLEHHREMLRGLPHRLEPLAPPAQPPRGRGVEAGGEAKERGLAAARRPEQRHELVAADREVDRGERARAARVSLLDRGELDDRRAFRVPRGQAGRVRCLNVHGHPRAPHRVESTTRRGHSTVRAAPSRAVAAVHRARERCGVGGRRTRLVSRGLLPGCIHDQIRRLATRHQMARRLLSRSRKLRDHPQALRGGLHQ